MKTLKQGIFAVAIATALTGLQIVLAPVSSASVTPSFRTTHEVPSIETQEPTKTLSWIEAQQRRYAKTTNADQQTGELTSEQQNKLVTMIRLMTLEL